jgi:hypothetical protein
VWNPLISSAYAHIKPATEASAGGTGPINEERTSRRVGVNNKRSQKRTCSVSVFAICARSGVSAVGSGENGGGWGWFCKAEDGERRKRTALCCRQEPRARGRGGGSANEDGERRKNVPRFVVDKPRLGLSQKRVQGDLRNFGVREEGASKAAPGGRQQEHKQVADSAQIERLDSIPSRCTTE